jgi:hypothetical protein
MNLFRELACQTHSPAGRAGRGRTPDNFAKIPFLHPAKTKNGRNYFPARRWNSCEKEIIVFTAFSATFPGDLSQKGIKVKGAGKTEKTPKKESKQGRSQYS